MAIACLALALKAPMLICAVIATPCHAQKEQRATATAFANHPTMIARKARYAMPTVCVHRHKLAAHKEARITTANARRSAKMVWCAITMAAACRLMSAAHKAKKPTTANAHRSAEMVWCAIVTAAVYRL